MRYTVEKREVHVVKVEVEAETPEAALMAVAQGRKEVTEVSAEYLEDIDVIGIGPLNAYQWRIYGPDLDPNGINANEI